MGRASSVAVVSIFLLSLAGAAEGEPILIRSGGVGFDTGDPPGLSLSGDAFSLVSLFPTIASPIACVPGGCPPGTSVSLSALFGASSFGFSLGSGFAVIGENSYGTGFGPGSVQFRGQLSFDAAAVPIPDGERVLRLTSPFLLTGSIAAFQDATASAPLFQVDVTGSGLAALVLERDTLGAYRFLAVDYTIQDPVPEPATLLLFGSGITVLAIRRCRRVCDATVDC
jgi:hypothetical protein